LSRSVAEVCVERGWGARDDDDDAGGGGVSLVDAPREVGAGGEGCERGRITRPKLSCTIVTSVLGEETAVSAGEVIISSEVWRECRALAGISCWS
jgi:hypothetical protein